MWKAAQRTAPRSSETVVKAAICQLLVTRDKSANLHNARSLIEKAAQQGAKLVVLPECFNCPYDTSAFPLYAERVEETSPSGETTQMLSDTARLCGVCVVGGSIPECRDGLYYNTCTVWGPDGSLWARYRKIHLFDIDIPGCITFRESDILSSGHTPTTFHLPGFGNVGLGICYDIRFPELALLYSSTMGARMLIYPGAFNTTTGPLHWELLQRARAVDNQCFVIAASPARNSESTYQAWGHSTITSPWGDVMATTGHEPALIFAEIDVSTTEKMRSQIPTLSQKRHDVYGTVGLPSG